MVWLPANTAAGEPFYYESETGAVSWNIPTDVNSKDIPVDVDRHTDADVPTVGGGTVKQKVDDMLANCPCFFRCCCTCLLQWTSPKGGCFDPIRAFFGAFLYGYLFVIFVFAVLQQTAMDRSAIDPFSSEQGKMITSQAWVTAFVFTFAVALYCLVAFTALPESYYEPGSLYLALLLGAIVIAIWIQQLLTVRYIFLRPELSKLRKNRNKKHKLCGRAYSTLNPGNWINYIYLSVVLAEFFIFASVCFHPAMPWSSSGSREVSRRSRRILCSRPTNVLHTDQQARDRAPSLLLLNQSMPTTPLVAPRPTSASSANVLEPSPPPAPPPPPSRAPSRLAHSLPVRAVRAPPARPVCFLPVQRPRRSHAPPAVVGALSGPAPPRRLAAPRSKTRP